MAPRTISEAWTARVSFAAFSTTRCKVIIDYVNSAGPASNLRIRRWHDGSNAVSVLPSFTALRKCTPDASNLLRASRDLFFPLHPQLRANGLRAPPQTS
jgi:hypothetical protein